MAHIDAKKKVIRGKIVFYGPGWCGKTTNLEYVNRAVPNTPEMMSLATEGDRTIFFDYLPMHLGKIRGIATSFKLYTVPGQVRYNQTRKMVLKNVDGVVFVADSQPLVMDANLESLQNLLENLAELGLDPDTTPIVLQYNKRDLPEVMPVEEMRAILNTKGYPEFEASATEGFGVLETLKGICSLVFSGLSASFGETPKKSRSKTIAGLPQTKATPAPKTATPAAAAKPPEPPSTSARDTQTKAAMAKAAKTPAPRGTAPPDKPQATRPPTSPAVAAPRTAKTPVPAVVATPVPDYSKSLSEISAELQKLVAETTKNRGALDGVTRELAALKKLVTGVAKSVSGLDTTMSDLEGTVTGLDGTVGGLEDTISGLQGKVEELATAAPQPVTDDGGEVQPSMSALAQLSMLAVASEAEEEEGGNNGEDGSEESLADDPRHEDAARIARVMVQDLDLYYGKEVAEGLKAGDLETRLKEAMEDMRRTYNARVDRAVRLRKDYLDPSVEAFLDKKKRSLQLS